MKSQSQLLSGAAHAWQPNPGDLDAAINGGDFEAYFTNLTSWLNQKTPAAGSISREAVKTLIDDPVFRNALDQRHLIATHGVPALGAFAKADPNGTSVCWARTYGGWRVRPPRPEAAR